MKAAQINEYGGASVITVQETPKPVAGNGQVLVEVHAASINPFDITVRSGRMRQSIPLTLPVTLGSDIAGVVTAVGSNVTNVAVGDAVYGGAGAAAKHSGAFAEFAVTSAAQIARAPKNTSFTQAASLPLAGVSALQALTQHIKLGAGQKILITGGTGGIGSIAVQIAKHLGAQVTATATGDGIALAQRLGANEVLDYKSQNLADLPRDFDAVFDTVGGETFAQAMRAVKPGGNAVSMIAQPDEALAHELGVTAMMQFTSVTAAALDQLRELVESGVVTPQIGKTFSLGRVADAFLAKEKGGIDGKVVIKIRS